MTNSSSRTVAIIGSGFSGICAFIQLKKELGIPATIFELNQDVGGTWLTNTYPGCACDVPSQLYSLSSELNPMKRASWINDQWKLEIQHNDQTEILFFDILFSGTGSLRVPNIPPMFKNFNGPVVHTAEWDHSIDYKDKRIALVGSGSSAAQVLPYLTNQACDLFLFQRSTPWTFPQAQKNISLHTKKLFSIFPFIITIYRWFLILCYERIYTLLGYPNSSYAKSTAKSVSNYNHDYLINSGSSDLLEKLEPTSRLGCHRIVQSSQFFSNVIKPHVTVINDSISEIKNDVMIAKDGIENQVDIIILATGYKTQEGVLGDLEIIGRQEESLTKNWGNQAPQLYKSTMIHGFPNLFMLLGPYTLTGHLSVVLVIEIQVDYAIQCLKKFNHIIEPTIEAQQKYMIQLEKDFQGTAWTSSCHSWYKNQSGVITSLYPNTVTRFWWELRQFNKLDYYSI